VDIAFYGCIIALGMILGIALVCYIAKTSGQDYNEYIDFALYAIIFSVIGARLYYVIFSWDYYGKHPNEILNIREGGLAIYGGVIAGVLVCLIYTRVKKLSFKKIADTAVYGLILGQIIGRWGNFFNREAFGGVAKDFSPLMMKIFFGDKYSISQVPDAVRQGK
jgi:phosphatidylglycerol:prolipoprotein diacylglycerol transferase